MSPFYSQIPSFRILINSTKDSRRWEDIIIEENSPSINDVSGPHQIYVHLDLADDMVGRPDLQRRCNMRFRDMVARGTVTKVKGLTGNTNKGWLRTPLGGNGGNQFYLFWTKTGLPAVPQKITHEEFPEAIWVRAVRHHDDHTPLNFGDPEVDYYPFTPEEIAEDNLFSKSPWTDEQLLCSREAGAVNLLYGHPGSGKTTTLLKIVEDSPGQSILFTTYSKDLTRLAEQYVASMAAPKTSVMFYDFAGLASAIAREDTTRLSLMESRRLFTKTLTEQILDARDFGPWRQNIDALYAETRAVLFGRAAVGAPDTVEMPNGMVRLSDKAYLNQRGVPSAVGFEAASSLLRVLNPLFDRGDLSGIFPEMLAAANAVRRLRLGELPSSMFDLDKILVDEAQDLCLLEATLLVELLLAVKAQSYRIPDIFLAGDEGQTVRPSGFQWNWIKSLLYKHVGNPREFEHTAHLRTAQRISQVISNSSELYRAIERGERPSGQRQDPVMNDNLGQVFYVKVDSSDEANSLIKEMLKDKSLRVTMPTEDMPDWLSEDTRHFVLTPALSKGLEYEKIAVIAPGELLSQVEHDSKFNDNQGGLTGHMNRTAIDNLRVVLSRATDLLVFVDMNPEIQAEQLSQALLGDSAVEISASSLLRDVLADDITPVETINNLLQVSMFSFKVDRLQGWNSLLQCLYLCDETYKDSLQDIYISILEYGSLLMVSGMPEGLQRQDVITKVEVALDGLTRPGYRDLFEKAVEWSAHQDESPVALLKTAHNVDVDVMWFLPAVAAVARQITDSLLDAASNPVYAGEFTDDVKVWLSVFIPPDVIDELIEGIYEFASHTLFTNGRLEESRRVLNLMPKETVLNIAKSVEEGESYDEGVFLHEFLGLEETARNIREDGAREYVEIATTFLNEEDFSSALTTCNKALSFLPGDICALEIRAEILHRMNRLQEALSDCDAVIKSSDSPEKISEMLHFKVDILNDSNASDKKIADCYKQLIRLNPTDPEFRQNLIATYHKMGNYSLAIEECNETIRCFPAHSVGYADLAVVHMENGNYTEALSALDRGFPVVGDKDTLVIMKFTILKKWQKPARMFETLIEGSVSCPDNAIINREIGRSLALDRKFERATYFLERSVRLGLDNSYERHALAAAWMMAYIHNNTNKSHLDKCIKVLSDALSIIDHTDKGFLPLMELRGIAYHERQYPGDAELRNADLLRSKKLSPKHTGLIDELDLEWKPEGLIEYFIPHD